MISLSQAAQSALVGLLSSRAIADRLLETTAAIKARGTVKVFPRSVPKKSNRSYQLRLRRPEDSYRANWPTSALTKYTRPGCAKNDLHTRPGLTRRRSCARWFGVGPGGRSSPTSPAAEIDIVSCVDGAVGERTRGWCRGGLEDPPYPTIAGSVRSRLRVSPMHSQKILEKLRYYFKYISSSLFIQSL